MLKQRPRPFNDLPHGSFTYGICLVTSRGGLPVWDSQVLESSDELGRRIRPRILDTTFPKELKEGAAGVVRVLRKDRETILVVRASIEDD